MGAPREVEGGDVNPEELEILGTVLFSEARYAFGFGASPMVKK